MNAIYEVRYGVLLGIAYVFLVLFFFAGHTVGRAEHNRDELQRIVRGE